MSDVRFGWLGESRRATVRSLIFREVAEWADEWWVNQTLADVDVSQSEHRRFSDPSSMSFALLGSSGSLVMFLGSKGLDGVGRHLAGALDEEDAGWAQRIGEQALNDLAARIYCRAGIASCSPLAESAIVPPDLTRVDLGSSVVTIALGRHEWVLAMDRRLVDRLVPPQALQQTLLVPRQSALDGVSLRIQAVIDFGSVNLTHLSDLHVGEILVGDRGLEEALQLHVEGHGAVATGYLRRSGTLRAVMLDGVNSQESHRP